MQYLYADGDLYNFMNTENYEQLALNQDLIGDALKFVKENEICRSAPTAATYSLWSLPFCRAGDH